MVTHAAQAYRSEINHETEIEILDLNEFPAPLFSVDVESQSGIPQSAQSLFQKIGQSDALLISYPEHNGLYPAVWKSLFDWMPRIDVKVFQDKPMIIFSTSPGRGGGSRVLKIAIESAPHFGAKVLASLSVPNFNHTFDVESGKLSDPELATQLRETLRHLK